ncbi:MAG: ImmA/IrrE family metallo-endopeptidase [Candidatus Thorarchaeota archaeon]
MARSAPALANPVILRWAREERGFEVELAASRIGVKVEKLKDCENGKDRLSFAQLRQAASIYKRPTATFYLKEPPSGLKIPTFRRSPANSENPLSPELRLEIRKFHQKRKAAIELIDYGPSVDWSHVGTISLTDNPEVLGEDIRSLLGISDEFPKGYNMRQAFNHWRFAIEKTGTLVFQASRVDTDEMRGLSITERPFPFIAVNRKDDPRPRSFSLLHEFAHVLLGNSSMCDLHQELDVKLNQAMSHEVFCNHVAGAALVPANLLLQTSIVKNHGKAPEWSASELRLLSERFRVSREVILRRLLLLKRTTDGFYGAMRGRFAYSPTKKRGKGGGEYAHQRVLHTDGLTFTSMVIDALDNRSLSYSDVTDLLGIKLKALEPLRELLAEKRS